MVHYIHKTLDKIDYLGGIGKLPRKKTLLRGHSNTTIIFILFFYKNVEIIGYAHPSFDRNIEQHVNYRN